MDSQTVSEPQSNHTPYDILGQEGVKALADAFYEAMDELPQAARVRAMHAEHLDEIKRKLAAYLTGWMGGPPVYLAVYGSVCLTEAHAPYAIGETEKNEWLLCMDAALDKINASHELRTMLAEPMQRIASAVQNSHPGPPLQSDADIIARGA